MNPLKFSKLITDFFSDKKKKEWKNQVEVRKFTVAKQLPNCPMGLSTVQNACLGEGIRPIDLSFHPALGLRQRGLCASMSLVL
jgi:hypothetical protein